ncbi:MAG: hypothetical protein VX185_14570 [Pseudomonadota bacterium]|nr:hypothetical protein [Pseudomonadota bacterium]
MTTGVYQSDNLVNTGYVQQEETDFDTNEDVNTDKDTHAEKLGANVDVVFRNSENFRDGQGQGRGQNGEAMSGFGELTLEEPEKNAQPEKGRSVYEKIVMMLFAYAKNIMDRRADRLEQMEIIGNKLTELAEQESQKFIEKVAEAEKKQKTGILGKIFAIIGLIIAVVVAAFTIAATPFTGGTSLMALPALLPSILAVAGVAFAAFAAGDALFNDSKLMGKIMEETIGKLIEGLTNLLKKAGMSDKAAQGLAMGLVMAAMIVVMVVVARSMNFLGNAAIKSGQVGLASQADDIANAANASKAAAQAGSTGNAVKAGTITTASTADDAAKAGSAAAATSDDISAAIQNATAQLKNSKDAFAAAKEGNSGTKWLGSVLAPNSTTSAEINVVGTTEKVRQLTEIADKTKKAKDIKELQKWTGLAETAKKELLSARTSVAAKDVQRLTAELDEAMAVVNKAGKSANVDQVRKVTDLTDELKQASKTLETARETEKVGDLSKVTTTYGTKAADTGGDIAKTGSASKEGANGTVKVEMAGEGDHIASAVQYSEKLERMAKYNRMSFRMQTADVVNDVGTIVHRETIAIINAQLDKLMAEDQADIQRLKAAMKILEKILSMHDEMSDVEVKQYEAAMIQLANFIIEKMPSISRPVVRVHQA